MSNKIAVQEADLENYCNKFFFDWKENYALQNYSKCEQLVIDFIAALKPVYNTRSYGVDSQSYTFIYVFLMLAKGLGDVIELVNHTKDKTWPQQNKLTEAIWYKLWDAKERLHVFDSHSLEKGFIEGIVAQLDELEIVFYEIFGRGIYASPEILIKKAECSVCKQNIKACMHIPGNIYDGVPCKEKVVDCQFLTVSLVQSPYDMRCRVWPWNMTPDMKITVRMMNLDQMDTFISETD